MKQQLSEKEIEENLNKLESLVKMLPSPRREKIDKMLETELGMNFISAPSSTRTEYHNAYPGGLLEHSLKTTTLLAKMCKSVCPDKFPDDTIVFVGLFHDLGKAGDGELPYYLPNESKWHQERGMMYEINKDIQPMLVADRTLFHMQKMGIELTDDEYLAIKLNDGYTSDSEFYYMKENLLGLLLQFSNRLAMELA